MLRQYDIVYLQNDPKRIKIIDPRIANTSSNLILNFDIKGTLIPKS